MAPEDYKSPMLSLPRALIFDWDLTLADNWPAVHEAINVVRAAWGLNTWEYEESKQCCNLPLRQSFPLWFGDDWKKAREVFYERYAHIHLGMLGAIPGAEELLRWLQTQNIPAFIVSNKQGSVLRKEVEHLRWTPYFKAIVGSSDASRDKPEREPVDLALSKAGMKADDLAIWFVGDMDSDMLCARNAGCTPVLLHNRFDPEQLNVSLSFSDCHALQSLLYSLAKKNKSPKEA